MMRKPKTYTEAELGNRKLKQGESVVFDGGGSCTMLWVPPKRWQLWKRYKNRRAMRRVMRRYEKMWQTIMNPTPLKPNEYKCAHCGGVFSKWTPEADMEAEAQENWPGLRPEEAAVICDPCYRKFIVWAEDEGVVGKPVDGLNYPPV